MLLYFTSFCTLLNFKALPIGIISENLALLRHKLIMPS